MFSKGGNDILVDFKIRGIKGPGSNPRREIRVGNKQQTNLTERSSKIKKNSEWLFQAIQLRFFSKVTNKNECFKNNWSRVCRTALSLSQISEVK